MSTYCFYQPIGMQFYNANVASGCSSFENVWVAFYFFGGLWMRAWSWCVRPHVCVRARMRLPSRVQVRLFVGKESTGVDVGRHGQLGAKVKIVWSHSEPPRRLLFWSLLFSWRVYFLVC